MIDWEALLAQLGSTAVIVTAIGYLASRGLDHYLAGRVESFKTDLEAEAAGFRAEMERLNKEHAVRFERLHAKRADVIESLFGLFSGIEPLLRMASDKETDSGQCDAALDTLSGAMRKLNEQYLPNRIYLPKELSAGIADLVSKVQLAVAGLVAARQLVGLSIYTRSQVAAQWDIELSNARATYVEMVAIMQNLESEFRAIVGDA